MEIQALRCVRSKVCIRPTWPNLILGDTCYMGRRAKLRATYRAAIAARPTAAVGYCGVGDSLRLLDYPGAAIKYYEEALKLIRPLQGRTTIWARTSGPGARSSNRPLRESRGTGPDYAWPHYDLGNILRVRGKLREAYQQYQEVLRLDLKIARCKAL